MNAHTEQLHIYKKETCIIFWFLFIFIQKISNFKTVTRGDTLQIGPDLAIALKMLLQDIKRIKDKKYSVICVNIKPCWKSGGLFNVRLMTCLTSCVVEDAVFVWSASLNT